MKCIEDEIPFDVPAGWNWCRIRDITTIKGGKRVPKGCSLTDVATKHAYIRVTDMKNNTVLLDDIKYIDDSIYEKIKSYTISSEDLYITVAGTIGAVGTIPPELDGMNLTENAVKATNIQINKNYLCLVIQSDLVQNQFQDKTHHVAMPKLAIERILSTFIPLPPLEEQRRIISRSEELVSNIDKISDSKDELLLSVDTVKAKILDLAIRGKLVPQNSEDEPASVLLERIRKEKEELIKQGKLKRDKKESIIYKGDDNSYYEQIGSEIRKIDEEIPFSIPETWSWCRLQNICSILTDGTHKTPSYVDEGVPFLSSKNVTSGKVDWKNVMYIPLSLHEELYKRLSPEVDDILLAKNGTTGKAALVDKKCVFDIYVSLALIRLFKEKIYPQYVLYALGSSFVQDYFNGSLKGIGVPNLHLEQIRRTLLPIPPINEQKKIFEKIETLMNLIEEIESALL